MYGIYKALPLLPKHILLICIGLVVVTLANSVIAQPDSAIEDVCPASGIQNITPDFEPTGIILTNFDKDNMWVYDIETQRRYPLPDTQPCTTSCRMSPDRNWLLYYNPLDYSYSIMRMDGTQRERVVSGASDVQWWTDEALLVWSTTTKPYLRYVSTDAQREYLIANNAISIQPGGRWAVELVQDGDDFRRILRDLSTTEDSPTIDLGLDTPYFNQSSWSPDGSMLAWVARSEFDASANIEGSEIFGIQTGDETSQAWTNLFGTYGAVRINGNGSDTLSWSPDGSKIAFWVIELTGADVETNTGNAVIHVLDVATKTVTRYCGFSTNQHTPQTPRLIWSPDSSKIAFSGNVTGDDRGFLILVLDPQTGIFTELSEGVYPSFGLPNILAWGNKP